MTSFTYNTRFSFGLIERERERGKRVAELTADEQINYAKETCDSRDIRPLPSIMTPPFYN